MYDLTKDYPAITEALRVACIGFAERMDHYGLDPVGSVREVSAASYDGFIAHTNGGFRVLVPCDLRTVEAEGMSEFESAQLQPYIDQSYRDAADAFVTDDEMAASLWEQYENDGGTMPALEWINEYLYTAETRHEAQSDMLGDVEFWKTSAGAMQERWHECTDHWFSEGATFFYELTVLFYEAEHRRNSTGSDEIFIFAGINTDFEYGRERGLFTVIERNYKLARLTPSRVATIVEAFAEKL